MNLTGETPVPLLRRIARVIRIVNPVKNDGRIHRVCIRETPGTIATRKNVSSFAPGTSQAGRAFHAVSVTGNSKPAESRMPIPVGCGIGDSRALAGNISGWLEYQNKIAVAHARDKLSAPKRVGKAARIHVECIWVEIGHAARPNGPAIRSRIIEIRDASRRARAIE